MRISSNMFFDQISTGLKENISDLNEVSNQLATGKKINKPSDDVLGTLKAMDYKLSISQNTQFQQNVTAATNYLNFNDTVLTQIATTLGTLKSLTQQNDQTTADKTVFADQAATLRDTLLGLSNSTYLNNYVFSGSQSAEKAYVYDASALQYVYQGDSQQMSVSLGKGITLAAENIPGNSSDPKIITPFSYTLQAAESITLPDGSTATYTPVVDPDPTHHYQTIRVDITNPQNPGNNDTFTFSNVMDIANVISYAFNNQGVDGTTVLTAQQAKNRIDALSDPLSKIQNQALSVQTLVGTRQNQLSDQNTRLASSITDAQNSLSLTQDADMDQTIVTFQKISTTLNALRSAAAKMLPQSLFDYLK